MGFQSDEKSPDAAILHKETIRPATAATSATGCSFVGILR